MCRLMFVSMKRLSVSLPTELAQQVEQSASLEGRTQVGLIRVALRAYFQGHKVRS